MWATHPDAMVVASASHGVEALSLHTGTPLWVYAHDDGGVAADVDGDGTVDVVRVRELAGRVVAASTCRVRGVRLTAAAVVASWL